MKIVSTIILPLLILQTAAEMAPSCLTDAPSGGGIAPMDVTNHAMQGLNVFFKVLKYSSDADPELKVVTGIFSAAHAVWKMADHMFQSKNTYKQLYEAAQLLMNYDDAVAMQEEGDTLNGNWMTASQYTTLYQNSSDARDYDAACTQLDTVAKALEDNFNLFANYYGNSNITSQMLLAHLPAQSTLHLSAYREQLINGTQHCGYTDNRVSQIKEEMNRYYQKYMDWYNQWTPAWANWRIPLVQEGDRNNRRFEVKDKLPQQYGKKDPLYCRGWLSRDSNEVAKDFTYGTVEAIQNDLVKNMLGLLDPMSKYLNRKK